MGYYRFEGLSIPCFSEALLQKSTFISILSPFFLLVRFLIREALRTVRERLLLPVGDHLEMYFELLGLFAERLMLLDGLNRYLHLEGSAVLFLLVFMWVKLIILLNLRSGLNWLEYFSLDKFKYIRAFSLCFNCRRIGTRTWCLITCLQNYWFIVMRYANAGW